MHLPPFLRRLDSTNLRLRIMSAVLMAPGALLSVWVGGPLFGLVVTAVMTLGLYEWLRLTAPQARAQNVGFACAILIAILVSGFIVSPRFGALLGISLTVFLFLICRRDHGERAGWIALGMPYMGGSGLAFLAIRDTPVNGAGLMMFLILTVWGADIGAFAAGRLIGGPKLVPKLSPNKTWAGLIGGIILASACGYGAARLFHAFNPWIALLLAPQLAVVAQAGDLFESYFKRKAGAKESGDLIPGHGGMLDRIDGLVFAGVYFLYFQVTIGNAINWW